MYIFFDENNEETLRYYLDELPEELKNKKYVKIDNIPTKEGYTERAKLVDDKIEWEYTKIKKPIDVEEEIENIKLQSAKNMMDILQLVSIMGGE